MFIAILHTKANVSINRAPYEYKHEYHVIIMLPWQRHSASDVT